MAATIIMFCVNIVILPMLFWEYIAIESPVALDLAGVLLVGGMFFALFAITLWVQIKHSWVLNYE